MTKRASTVGLASASPRRFELLTSLGLRVQTLAAGIDERRHDNESVSDYVRRLAIEKAQWATDDLPRNDIPVVAGDTAVAIGETLFDKPNDEADAVAMLMALSGRTHAVHTSVSVYWQQRFDVAVVVSYVTFANLSEREARAYWATGEPADKAGAYAIQGLGGKYVKHLSGSFSAVMGLPVFETWQMLTSLDGWSPQQENDHA